MISSAKTLQSDVCLIDDFGPLPVVQPQSVAELSSLVCQAAAEGLALYPLGGQTLLSQGFQPTRPGRAVDLRRLTQVIDYPARDMTITVQAGITLAELQKLLATENQRLPIDVPLADLATLGGAIATNTSGPRRFGFGTLRDYVIGISVINDEGQEVKAGGRVVKNVAGYDLCKLYIGSLGTLGITTQVTLKLKPRPEEQTLMALGCKMDGVEALLEQLHRSRTRPVCLDLLNQAAVQAVNPHAGTPLPDAPWVVVVGFEENREAVQWQVQELIKESAPDSHLGVDARVGVAADPLWQALVDFPARSESRLTFKANLLPSATAAFCRQASAFPEALRLQAHAGNGMVLGLIENEVSLSRAQEILRDLLAAAVKAQGNLTVLRCPPAWKAGLPIWGAPRGDIGLMRTIKEKFDPKRLFNPGRFVEGL